MRHLPFICSAIFFAGCSTSERRQAADTALTTSAVIVAAPLVPVADAYHALAGTGRVLLRPNIYCLTDGVYAVSNELGWFTNKSERKSAERYQSAWIVDVSRNAKDQKSRLILSEDNLERWFFRDHDYRKLISVQEWNGEQQPPKEYFVFEAGTPVVMLHTSRGLYTLYLKQK